MTTTIAKTGFTTVTPIALDGFESTRQTGNVLHDILGRPDYDVTFAAAGLRSGTLKFWFDTYAKALACEALYAAVGFETLADSDVPGVGMKHVASGAITVSLEDENRSYWTVAVDFQEIA